MNVILARLREPSTYAGIAALLAGATFIPHASEIARTVSVAGMFISGILAIWLPEQKA